ncbi:uncharacterized protein LOC119687239 [Teleopsis dalmanni]|uniref:uncharacterized protein LOC119687239 n=1 Tax=Teleopsis dalmanni TaxID=139649 RepID=UPI0018CD9F9A|nr:uncharacterized protein LOC119687239 [Teleopsis dalmanni]
MKIILPLFYLATFCIIANTQIAMRPPQKSIVPAYYDYCFTGCDLTCPQLVFGVKCVFKNGCRRGYFCGSGYVRNVNSHNECISEDRCKLMYCSVQYRKNYAFCEKNCQNVIQKTECKNDFSKPRRSGYFCSSSFVRRTDEHSECIPERLCHEALHHHG